MWRLRVVVAVLITLGAIACADPRDPGRCIGSSPDKDDRLWFGTQPSREFHRLYSSRLDVALGEAARLTIVVQNTQGHDQVLNTGLAPLASFVVTDPDCRTVWYSPLNQLLPSYQLQFEPHEVKRFSGDWSLTDNWGELIPQGEYFVYGTMAVSEGPNEDLKRAQLVVSELVTVDEPRINAVRPRHPPAPVDASPCGTEPASGPLVHKAMEEHSEMLEEWGRWAVWVLAADLLDENRMSTGRRAIRVVHVLPQDVLEDSPLSNLPKCLDSVPVQLVMRPDD